MRIRGKEVHFGSKEISGLYGLADANHIEFEEKDYAPVSWLVSQLCLGRYIPWETTKRWITLNDFMDEARI